MRKHVPQRRNDKQWAPPFRAKNGGHQAETGQCKTARPQMQLHSTKDKVGSGWAGQEHRLDWTAKLNMNEDAGNPMVLSGDNQPKEP